MTFVAQYLSSSMETFKESSLWNINAFNGAHSVNLNHTLARAHTNNVKIEQKHNKISTNHEMALFLIVYKKRLNTLITIDFVCSSNSSFLSHICYVSCLKILSPFFHLIMSLSLFFCCERANEAEKSI